MRHHKQQDTLPLFTFTPEMLQITQAALTLFAQSLQRVERSDAKTAFATETMHHVKEKLDAQSRACDACYLTTFDYNEKIVIATAIQLYTLDLLATPAHAQRDRTLDMCRQIACFALDNLPQAI